MSVQAMFHIASFCLVFCMLHAAPVVKEGKDTKGDKTDRPQTVDLPSFAAMISKHPQNVSVRTGQPFSIRCQQSGYRNPSGPMSDLNIFKNGQLVQSLPDQVPNTNIGLDIAMTAMSNCCTQFGGVDISGYRSDISLSTESATQSHAGQYHCTTSSPHGSHTSTVAVVTVF